MSDLSEITNKESKIIASSGKYVNSNLATPNGPQYIGPWMAILATQLKIRINNKYLN